MYMERNLKLVKCSHKYWEFVRLQRMDERNIDGFIKTAPISPSQQKQYMKKYCKNYWICLLGYEPVGFIGVIDNDIRVCTKHEFKKKGVGRFMVESIKKIKPNLVAKIKIENTASRKLFESCGFKKRFFLYES